jgi:hypothetical protein
MSHTPQKTRSAHAYCQKGKKNREEKKMELALAILVVIPKYTRTCNFWTFKASKPETRIPLDIKQNIRKNHP